MKRLLAAGAIFLTGLFLFSHGVADTAAAKKKAVKKTAFINQAKCIKCGTCAKVCPVKAITIIKKDKKITYVIDPKKCIGCGTCIKKCPSKAIAWDVPHEKTKDTSDSEVPAASPKNAPDAPVPVD